MTLRFVLFMFVWQVATEVKTNTQTTSLAAALDRYVQNNSNDYSGTSSNVLSSYTNTPMPNEKSTGTKFFDSTRIYSNEQMSQRNYISKEQAMTTDKVERESFRTKLVDNSTGHGDIMTPSTLNIWSDIKEEREGQDQENLDTLQTTSIENRSTRIVTQFPKLFTQSDKSQQEYTSNSFNYQFTGNSLFSSTQNPKTKFENRDQYLKMMSLEPKATNIPSSTPRDMESVSLKLDEVTTQGKEEKSLLMTTHKSKQNSFDHGICEQYGECPHAEKEWFCHCDEHCLEYNDCCQGYTQQASLRQVRGNYTCIRVDQENRNFFGIYVIATCPAGFANISIIDKCLSFTNLKNGPPVINKHNTVQVFANIYCALCYGIKEVIPITIQVYNLHGFSLQEIESFDSVSDLMSVSKTAKFRLIVDSQYKLRKCIYSLQESNDIECQRYTNPIVHSSRRKDTLYRNTHCINESLLTYLSPQASIVCLARVIALSTNWSPVKLSVIFSFRQQQDNGEINGLCSVWKEEVDQLCSHLPTYVNAEETMDFVLQVSSNVSEITDIFLIQVALTALWTYTVPDVSKLNDYSTIWKADNRSIIKVELTVQVQKRCFRFELEKIFYAFRHRSIDFIIKTTKEDIKVNLKSQSSSQFGVNFTLFETFHFSRFIIYKTLTSLSIKLMPTIRNNNVCRNITVKSELIGNELVIKDLICGSHTTAVGISPLEVLTYVEFTLSTITLVPLIVVNRRINQRMTLPRTNIENISLSLIGTNCLFMIGIGMMHVAYVCYVIGIALHYLFLTTFVFMTIGVVSVSLAVVSLKTQRNRTKEKIKRDRLFVTILGLTLPLVIVCPAVMMDRFGPPNWSPGYGHTACFPTRFPGNVAFFSGPVVLMLAIDLVCLLCIIIHVERTSRNTRRLLNISRTSDDVKLYLRLVVLSGTLWLIGVVAVFFDSTWLDYIFTLSCGLHGLLISVAGLSTKEVREKIKCHREQAQTPTS